MEEHIIASLYIHSGRMHFTTKDDAPSLRTHNAKPARKPELSIAPTLRKLTTCTPARVVLPTWVEHWHAYKLVGIRKPERFACTLLPALCHCLGAVYMHLATTVDDDN